MTQESTERERRSNGHDPEQLVEVAQAIGREMVAVDPDESKTGLSLAVGLAGYSLLGACLARVHGRECEFSDFARRCLQKISIELPRTEPVYPGLFTGLTGIAWATRVVTEMLEPGEQSPSDSDDEILDFVEGYLNIDAEFEYDLISGLAGIGMWVLTTPEGARRSRVMSRVLDLLERSSEPTHHGGRTWRTPLARERRFGQVSPISGPEYNLGLAHGIPGIVGLLALCIETCVEQDRAKDLIDKVLRWLQPQMREGLAAFPITAGSSGHSRAAWCYGDPGVSLTLHRAAHALKSNTLKELARDVTTRFCARRLHNSSVNDASLCHGSAGLVLICQKLGALDPSASTEGARRYWLDVLLTKQDPHGVCGFPYWNGLSRRYERSFSFLNGAVGVGLTLLSEAGRDANWSFPVLLGQELLASSEGSRG